MNRRTVLLVEDNPDDVELTLKAFKTHAITNEVAVVRDGAEALDYLFATGNYASRNVGDLPSIILLDINLPKIGGLDVLRSIRADERTRLQPVIVLTSSSEEQDILTSYKLGANSYVRKPVDFVQFVEAVKNLGLFWLILNEPLPES